MLKTAIITTVYNEINNIDRFLLSLANQTKMPDTIVIVDGGSNDGTFSQLLNFKKVFLDKNVEFILKRQVCNIAQGRNYAIAETDADIICVTDAGVLVNRDWFQKISQPLLDYPNLDCVGGNFLIGGNNLLQRAFHVMGYKNKASNSPSSRSFAFRRYCWQAYPYPEYLRVHEDTKLCEVWKDKGFRFAFASDAFVVWQAEKTIYKLYRKFAFYTEWLIISGDRIDTLRKLQLATYGSAILLMLYSILFAIIVIALSILTRVVRQYSRVFSKLFNAEGLRLLPWAFLVQLILDVAVISGTIRGFIRRVFIS